MVDFYDELAQILNNDDEAPDARHDRIRELLIQSLASGKKKEDLYSQMLSLHETVSGEWEEMLLDAMDHLTGWCNPEYRITGD